MNVKNLVMYALGFLVLASLYTHEKWGHWPWQPKPAAQATKAPPGEENNPLAKRSGGGVADRSAQSPSGSGATSASHAPTGGSPLSEAETSVSITGTLAGADVQPRLDGAAGKARDAARSLGAAQSRERGAAGD